MLKIYIPLLITFFSHLVFSDLYAQVPVLGFNSINGLNLSSPIEVTNAGDGSNRLFIVEKGGRIKIYNGTNILATPFLDLSSIVSTDSERGLLSVAFHPAYASNGYFFVYYTNLTGAITVARYSRDTENPDIADAGSGVVLLTIPKTAANHNGGHLEFGPEGYLYFATGDGGGAGDPNNNAQNGNSLLGKMIRIDVSNFLTEPYYTIPADNPFVADPTVRDEIWALGLRNPFRWSFDPETYDMWIGDVGQSVREEVNFRAAGTTGGINYGWKCYEAREVYSSGGACDNPGNFTFPIYDYSRNNDTGGQCITGGVVYRGTAHPVLSGYYICADFLSGNGWLIKRDAGGNRTVTLQTDLPDGLVSFGRAENGEIYSLSLTTNSMYAVTVTDVLPLTLKSFSGNAGRGFNELIWSTSYEADVSVFEVEFSKDGNNFQKAGSVAASNISTGAKYTFMHHITAPDKLYYRLKMVDKDRQVKFSEVITIDPYSGNSLAIIPAVVTNQVLNLQLMAPFNYVQLMDMNGRVKMFKGLNGQTGDVRLDLSGVGKGVYVIRLGGSGGSVSKKVIVQ